MRQFKHFLFTRLLALSLLLGLLPLQAQAQYSGSGAGTANDPYLIFNPAQLNQMRNFLNQTVYFQLMNDIDMSAWIDKNSPANGWQPIGTNATPFKGILMGNGHKITGMHSSSTTSTCGFFGYLAGATVSDLTLEVDFSATSGGGFAYSINGGTTSGINITGTINCTDAYTGGLAAKVSGSAIISNVTFTGTVSGKDYTGGLIGTTVSSAKYTDCRAMDSNIKGESYTGGIFGCITTGIATSLTNDNCQALNCSVSGTNSVGGLAGYVNLDQATFSEGTEERTFNNCFFNGEISGHESTGGLIGQLEIYAYWCAETSGSISSHTTFYSFRNATITLNNCGSNAIISGATKSGGLIGRAYLYAGRHTDSEKTTLSNKYSGKDYYSSLNISDCFALGSINATDSKAGGLIGEAVSVGSYNQNNVTDSYFNGSVSSPKENIGGLLGYSERATIERCYAAATISGSTGVGGIIGSTGGSEASYNKIKSSVSACPLISATESAGAPLVGNGAFTYGSSGTSSSNKIMATSVVSVNGEILRSFSESQGDQLGEETLKMRATYQGLGWNFTNNWAIQETECYPYKLTQTAPPIITNIPETGSMVVYGKSISGGKVYVTVAGATIETACDGTNTWTVRLEEPLKAGQVISAYAVADGLLPSFSVQTTVGYLGSGTEDDPYQVYTVSDLAGISGDAYYLLMNDLDLSKEEWTPIGNNGGAMCHFNGDSHVISGMKINSPATPYCGLFASMHSGSIKNVVIKEASVTGADNCGILAGSLSGVTVTNCQVEGTVNSGDMSGGLCGSVANSTISGCRVIADINGGDNAGGVAGTATATSFTLLTYNGSVTGKVNAGGIVSILDDTSTVDRCFSAGSVTTTATGDTYAGGITGVNNNSIVNSYSTATITSTQYGAGIAALNKGAIDRCYSNGNINSGKYAAGIAGYDDGTAAQVTASLSANEFIKLTAENPIGMRVVGGIRNGAIIPELGSNYALEQMIISLNGVQQDIYDDPLNGVAVTSSATKAKETYTDMGWDFAKTWNIDGNGGMPYLTELGSEEGGSILPDNYLTIADVNTEAGKRIELSVDLRNKNEIAGVQFDIALPEGFTIATDTRNRPLITLGSRINSTKHSISSRIGGNGLMRVLLMTRNTVNAITGNAGEVVKIGIDVDETVVNGTYKVEIKNIVLSDVDPTVSIYPPVCPAKIIVNNDHLLTSACSGQQGGTAKVSVEMENKSQIVGYQFDLILPEGITVATNAQGKPAYAHGERASNVNHTFTIRDIADHVTRVLCFSPDNSVIPANTGELFNIMLNIPETYPVGDVPIHFRNIYLSNTNNASIAVDDLMSTLTVKRFVRKGDINVDGTINLSDVTALTDIVVGKTNDRLDTEAADINEDGSANMQDLPLELNLVFDEPFYTSRPSGAPALATANRAASKPELKNMQLYIEPFQINPGETKSVRFYVYNPEDEVFGFQMRTELPEGLEFVQNEDGLWGVPCEERSEPDFTLNIDANRGGFGIAGYNGINLYTLFGTEGAVCEAYIKASETAKPGVYKEPVFETLLTDSYGAGFLTLDNYFTVIVGDVTDKESMAIDGYLTDISVADINKAIAGNSVITELDLTGVLGNKSSAAFNSANPNMLIACNDNITVPNAVNVISGDVCDNLVLTDGYPFGTTRTFTAGKASYTRTFAAMDVETLYLPFTADIPESIWVETIDELKFDGVNLNFSPGTQQAHVPCVATVPEDGSVTLTGTQVVVTPEPEQAFENFVGSYRHAEASGQHFDIKGMMPKPSLSSAAKLAPFRAYVISDPNNPPVLTGIDSIKADDGSDIEVIYNLQGIRMRLPKDQLPSGLYIINGEKVAITADK